MHRLLWRAAAIGASTLTVAGLIVSDAGTASASSGPGTASSASSTASSASSTASSASSTASSASSTAGATGGAVSKAQVKRAATVLMSDYDPATAYWDNSWWNSAVAVTTVVDYTRQTGDKQYLPQIEHTFDADKGHFAAGTLSGDEIYGNFESRAIDDTMWWGLAWLDAYDLTHQKKFLDSASGIGDYVYRYWDPSTCGGGVWWNAEKTYKNAVTNGQFVRMSAQLAERLPGTAWRSRAIAAWNWFKGSGLIDSDGLVNDGLTDQCANNGQNVWTYNQGLAIGGATEIYRLTHDRSALVEAEYLADVATTSPVLVTDGVLSESCDTLSGPTCDDNQKQFKGIFMRYLGDLNHTTGGRYNRFVSAQIRSITTKDTDGSGRIGVNWRGLAYVDHINARDWRTQASGLEGLLAGYAGR